MKRFLYLVLIIQLSVFHLRAEYSDHRNRHQDSLEQVLQTNLPTGDDLLRLYDNVMWGYLQTDGEKCAAYALKLIEAAKELDAPGSVENGYRALGMCAYGSCHYDSAAYCFDKAIEWAGKMRGHKRQYSDTDIDNSFSALYGTLANLYSVQGKVHLANEYYLKALEIFERHHWNHSAAIAYYNMGETFLEMSNNQQAEIYYRKAITFADPTGDSLIMAMPRHGLALVLLNSGKTDEALQYALESLPYYADHEEEERVWLLDMQVLFSRIYQEGYHDLARAQEYMNEARRLIPLVDAPTNVSDACAQQATLCLERRQWREAVTWADSALAVNDQDPHHNIGLYKTLAEAYAALGRSSEAQHYIELLHDTMGKLAENQFQSSLSEMEVLYETNKKEAQIELMQQEAKMHQLQIVALWLVLGALLMVAAIVGVVVWQRRRLAMIEAKMQGEADERTRLGRDLHDRLGSLLTAIRLTADGATSDTSKISTLAAEAQTEMRRVAHHLMPESLHNEGLRVALHDFVASLPIVTFHFTGTDRRLTEQQETMLYCTGHELVNNALKHAHARHIDLQLLLTDEFAALLVTDDGTGFDAQKMLQSGMGLANIRSRAEAMNGRFDISSTERGTEINVEIPLK